MSGKIIYDRSEKNFHGIYRFISSKFRIYMQMLQEECLKRVVTPLNYNEHLKLKYDYSNINLGNSLVRLILNGEEQNAIKYENEMNRDLINNIEYNFNDWDEYLKYGGFPILARKNQF